MSNFTLVVFLVGLGLFLVVKRLVSRGNSDPRRLPLPPGPKGLPLVGNMFDLPQIAPWEGYDKLCKEYGDMIYLKTLGQGMVVLGSRRRVVDLLDKRAAIYSDRPVQPMMEMMEVTWNFAFLPYGVEWRQHRRAFHKYLNNHAVQNYHPIMSEETKLFLQRLQLNPDNVFTGLQFLFGTMIMRTAYGFDDIKQNESLVHNAEKIVLEMIEAMVPGRYLLDYLPILRFAPSWFPGAGFKKTFKDIAQMSFDLRVPTFEKSKSDMENGWKGTHPSIAHGLIDGLPEESDPSRKGLEDIARDVCGVAYLAGAETTVSSATALVYVLANYPEVQKKAQAEIDKVIGSDRLPLVSDREELPYVHAIVKEVGRWHSVVPLGVVHANTEDDEYDGFFIPKGSSILQNNWAIMHDPEIFDRPFEYIPERYLKDGKIDPSVPDAEIAAFGHGRRICPGRYFSNDALFLMAASLLATFDISAPRDEDGNVIPMKLEARNPSVSKPQPFKCEIRLRPGRAQLLQ